MSAYKYIIKNIYQPDAGLVVIEAGDRDGHPIFSFRPGQYVMITYRDSQGRLGDKHAFSIASSPIEKGFIRLGIRVQGDFTKGLLNLKQGDELIVDGPYGNFIYDEKKYPDAVFIAGGIGVTPFFSALEYAFGCGLNNKLAIIYSARTAKSAVFCNEIGQLKARNPNISTLFSFTEEKDLPEADGVSHLRIDAEMIKGFVGDISGKTFFLCGPASFMAAMKANLLSLGVSKKQIRMEGFSMIPDQKLGSRLKNLAYALGFAIALFAISFGLLTKSFFAPNDKSYESASIQDKKNYDPALANKVNKAAYDRMMSIRESRNKALSDLKMQTLEAAKNSGNAVINQPSIVQNQVVTPPTPVPMPMPMPRTRVS